jgi:putative ABC transport system permease protein
MPDWKPEILRRLAPLKLAPTREAEIADELSQHLEDRYQELLASGESEDAAFLSALDELKGEELLARSLKPVEKAFYREPIVPGKPATTFFEGILQDIRYAFRMLRKSPGFTAVAVLTLALGIGANTTIFSAISAILLRKPPVKNPDSLCAVASADKVAGNDLVWASAPDFKSWQAQNDVFENMAAIESGRSFTLTGKNGAQAVDGDRVTPDYFQIIGIPPVLGRTFLPSESQAGNDRVVILSNSLWRERYNSDPNILGKRLEIDRVPYTIVGVMPRGAALALPSFPPRLWTPLVFAPSDLTPSARDNHYLNMIVARLKPGVTLKRAQSEMDSVAERLAREYPGTNKHWGVVVLTLQEYLIRVKQVRPAMMMLLTVVGLVLLIACANIAGLLLARGSVRAHEMAVRAAIGAGKMRLIRQLLTESLLVGLTGGIAGLISSIWGIHLLRVGFNFNVYGAQLARSIRLDQRTLLFTVAISILSAIVFGLAPAFRSSNINPGDALNEGSRTGSRSFARSRLRNVLVTGEIVLAVVLLAGAGVNLQEVIREFSEPVGFNAHHLVIANLHLDSHPYQEAATRTAFFERVTEKLRNIPGVEDAALDNCVPLGCGYSTSFAIVGQSFSSASKTPSANYLVVGPGYFRTMQIPIMKGRDFIDSDTSHTPTVAIVNQEFARRYFPKGGAIGKWIEATTLDAKRAQIVGIVGNVSEFLGQIKPDPQIYESDLQFPFTAFSETSLVVRSRIASSALVPMVRGAVWSVDLDQPVDGIQTMEDLSADDGGGDKLIASLLGIFAGLALVLAGVGIYGVIAYSVSQRTREIGIRVALGAQQKDVLRLVLGDGALLTGIGCAIGVLLALPLPRILSSLSVNGFPRVQGLLVSLAVTLIVATISLVATYIPARRAMTVDPMVALRYE